MARVNVKQIRDNMGVTQVELARRLGVHHRTILRWENGEVDPSPLAVRRLREVHADHQKGKTAPSEQTPTDNALTHPRRFLPSME